MTAEERAFNYASTQKPTKLQVGEIAKHYNNCYQQAMQDFLEKAELFFNYELYVSLSDQICSVNNFTSMSNFVEYFKNYMQDESEN